MFKKDEFLEKREGKKIIKEAEKSIIVLNETRGCVMGEPEGIFKSTFCLLDQCIDKGVFGVETLLDYISNKKGFKAIKVEAKTPQEATEKINKELKKITKKMEETKKPKTKKVVKEK